MNKTLTIFEYGSLINEKSLKKTVPSVTNIRPTIIYGFLRIFNLKSTSRFDNEIGKFSCILNVEKAEEGLPSINGICFDMPIEEFEKLLEREKAYELVQVEAIDYNNKNNRCRAFMFRAKHYDTYPYQYESEKQEEYLQICIEGCKNFGDDFYEKFCKTTFIEEGKIIDDLLSLSRTTHL